MNDEELYIGTAVFIMVLVNYFTRVLPFLFFRDKTPPPAVIFLESYFPPVIMTILVFYSLKDIDFSSTPYGAYEMIGVGATVLLHLVFKNFLLSIFGATIIYMSLVQGWFL